MRRRYWLKTGLKASGTVTKSTDHRSSVF